MLGKRSWTAVMLFVLGGGAEAADTGEVPDRPPDIQAAAAAAGEVAWAANMLPPESVLAGLADWLSARLDLPRPESLPRLALASPQDLVTRRYGPLVTTSADIGSTATLDIVALYDDHERTIFVAPAWAPAGLAGLSVLIHEMVHHMQNMAGMKYACAEEREREAFAAQADWLAMFGTDLATEFGIDPLTLLVRTKCFY